MAYTLTPARRAALKRAQLASAARRRGKGKGKLAAAHRALGAKGPQGKFAGKKGLAKNVAKVGGFAAAAGGAVYAGHHFKNTVSQKKDIRGAARKRLAAKHDDADKIKVSRHLHGNDHAQLKASIARSSLRMKSSHRFQKARKAAKKHLK